MKKVKNIHLTEDAIKALSIQAIDNGTNFKKFVENILEIYAKACKVTITKIEVTEDKSQLAEA